MPCKPQLVHATAKLFNLSECMTPADYESVGPDMACPDCGEDDMDALLCNDDDLITCTNCGRVYVIEDAWTGLTE